MSPINTTNQKKQKAKNNTSKQNAKNLSEQDIQALVEERVKERNDELDTKELNLIEREEQLIKDRETIETLAKTAEEAARKKILESAEDIIQAEKDRLEEQWLNEENQKRLNLANELEASRQETARLLEQAHEQLMKAEKEIFEKKLKANTEIQNLQKEYQDKTLKNIDDYNIKKTELQEKEQELKEQKENLEFQQMELKEQREIYLESNPQALIRLKNDIAGLKQMEKTYLEIIAEQRDHISSLTKSSLDENEVSNTETIKELKYQLEQAQQLLDKYINYPSEDYIEELKNKESMYNKQKELIDDLNQKIAAKDLQINTMNLDQLSLENERKKAKALETLNRQFQDKLDFIISQYENVHESKFQGLQEIDNTHEVIDHFEDFRGSLRDLVTHIRNYGASANGEIPLYYSEETIRVFIASLAATFPSSRLIILQGLSGTGKSSLPTLFSKALNIHCNFISVQPSWRDNRELLGYDNDFTNRFKETEFTKAVYNASRRENKDDIYFIVLDEMNLARIEYYFADFLSELEHRNAPEWKIPLVSNYSESNNDLRPKSLNYSNGTASLIITKNIWFIGTANNDDSTSTITDKVYDRAQILDMDTRESPFEAPYTTSKHISWAQLITLFDRAKHNTRLQMNENDWKTLKDIDDFFLKDMDITFGNRMKTQLEDFVPVYKSCGGTTGDAIDYFLAHKILRKLDDKYDAYITKSLDELERHLESLKEYGKFERSIAKIKDIKKRNFDFGDN